MDIKEFSKIMQYLAIAYDKDLNEEKLAVWYDFFKKYDVETFKNGILQAISKCKYYPSIAEVKEIITMQSTPQANLKADEEWEKVRQSIRIYGMYREEEALASLNPITRNIVKRVGFRDICLSDENTRYNLRSAFVRAFNSEKEDLIKYESAVKDDTEDMKMIRGRNKEMLNDVMSVMIKRIDCETNE